ncbi:MAG: phosphatidylglycerophosphatase A [Candidatus Omnitrophica bacterium]|nr:phosphatidylglycerophosphatase A [Candidatus Omnitrophota bacterium]
MKKTDELIATVLGLGYLPLMPGTWGSLGGLVMCFLLRQHIILYSVFFALSFFAGVVFSGRMEKNTGIKDPSSVVIDEFACMFPVFLFVPMTPLTVILGFSLYRVFDIMKVPPMRRLEMAGGGWGIMLDDLVSAVYANLILQFVLIFVL